MHTAAACRLDRGLQAHRNGGPPRRRNRAFPGYTSAPQANDRMTEAHMHVAPEDLSVVRQGDLLVRFAPLGAMAYVLAELPRAGSPGTPLETPCERPHWGLVVDG